MSPAGPAQVRSAIDLLEAWIEAQRAQRELPGIAIGIVHDQTLLWTRGFGWGDMERREAATPATLYRIGSITKTYVGHGGSVRGFRSELRICPADQLAVMAFINADDGARCGPTSTRRSNGSTAP